MVRQRHQKHPALLPRIDRSAMHRVLIVGIARTAAVPVLTLLLYVLIPADGFNDENPAAAWVGLVLVALVFLGAMTFQVRLVTGAKAPIMRAAEAIVQIVVLFLSLFALLYVAMSTSDPLAFSEPLSRVDGLYFTSTTLATVGFGDITPKSDLARAVVTVQMLAGLGVLVLVREGLPLRSATSAPAGMRTCGHGRKKVAWETVVHDFRPLLWP